MAQQTRHGVSGFARPPYASFAGKVEQTLKFFIMQPDTVVWFMPDNRSGLEFSVVTGDALTPEYQMQARGIGWPTNRARIVFKSGS